MTFQLVKWDAYRKAKNKFENTTHLVVDTEPMPNVVNGLVRVESESRRAEQVALVIFNSISNLNTLTSLYDVDR